MDGVVSAHDGSVVVCGGHGVQWMVWSVHVLAVWWYVVDMWSNGWRGQCICWQCVWWTWGPMDGVVSAHDGSVVVCGGHGVQIDGMVSARADSVVVCGGHGVQ